MDLNKKTNRRENVKTSFQRFMILMAAIMVSMVLVGCDETNGDDTPTGKIDPKFVGIWTTSPMKTDPLKDGVDRWIEFKSNGTFIFHRPKSAWDSSLASLSSKDYYSTGFNHWIFKGNYTVSNNKIYCKNVLMSAITDFTDVKNIIDYPINDFAWRCFFADKRLDFYDKSTQEQESEKYPGTKWLHISTAYADNKFTSNPEDDGMHAYAKPGSVTLDEFRGL